MTEYYSDIVKIQNAGIIVQVSQPNNIPLLVNWGDGSAPYAVLSATEADRTSSATITITNSHLTPTATWQYYDEILENWVDIKFIDSYPDDSDPFLQSLVVNPPSNPQMWGYQLVVLADADLEIWGNRSFRLNVEQFVDGEVPVAQAETLPFQFIMDWGTPPDAVRILQPQDQNWTPMGVSFSTEYKIYGDLVSEIWQYSDNYDQENPESATWVDVPSGSGNTVSVASSGGDDQSIGYGIKGTAPAYVFRSSSLSVSVEGYVNDRVYRHKFIAN